MTLVFADGSQWQRRGRRLGNWTRTRRRSTEILRRYLEAWTPILSLGDLPTIAYVDGFAGPGVYSGGEDGSPIIAVKAALQHQAKIKAKLLFLFIEKENERADLLQQLVTGLALPTNFRTRVVGGKTVDDGFREHLLDFYEKQRKQARVG